VQGWLSEAAGAGGSKQAEWRTDPERSGPGGAVADIGVHAFTLAEFVTGVEVDQLLGDLGRVVPGRRVDDDATALLRFAGGARGVLTASQVSTGEGNELTLDVYGDLGSLSWSHGRPDRLVLRAPDGTRTELSAGRGAAGLCSDAGRLCRLPAHHPEGFVEAFANLYRDFADDVRSATGAMRSPAPIGVALRGMAFIDAMLRSSAAGQRWVELDSPKEVTTT
jgi:predicted dehydrogenase